MVMETPSPQCVGREFVRQYYTLLNEAPAHLHRFYSSNSSFVHGGVEPPGEEQPPIIGQLNIHKKILSLNFRDCHAKIRQVDSQATVGNAVVVQVSGELSNNGQQMRRFMQTFILAPQSQKKYYVHNDIFRYQDEVYRDTDSEPENIEVNELISDSEVESIDQATSPETVQDITPTIYESAPILSNGNAHVCEVNDPVAPYTSSVTSSVIVEPVEPEPEPYVEPYVEEPKAPAVEPKREIEVEPTIVEPPQPVETKPVTWAALASKNSGGSSTSTVVHSQMPSIQSKPMQGGLDANPLPQRTALNKTGPSRDRARDRERTSVGRGDGDGDSDSQSSRRGPRMPDTHQLFVGNLPSSCTNKDLKETFSQYGNVTDVRITNKHTGAFGFVTYDSPDPVRTVLDLITHRPIMLNNVGLNVEEKKPRDMSRMSGGGMRGGGGQRMGGPPPRGGAGGGPMNSRGGGRGGGSMRGDRGGGMRGGFGAPRR